MWSEGCVIYLEGITIFWDYSVCGSQAALSIKHLYPLFYSLIFRLSANIYCNMNTDLFAQLAPKTCGPLHKVQGYLFQVEQCISQVNRLKLNQPPPLRYHVIKSVILNCLSEILFIQL